MPTRRFVFAAAPALLAAGARGFRAPGMAAWAAPVSDPDHITPNNFQLFLSGVRTEARRAGISEGTLDRAFAGVSPNQKVLERDRHQPEFTLTWARYRALVITEKRITDGRQAVAANRALFQRVADRFGVNRGVIAGIWGLESSFGTGTGDFRVVEALATLSWEGRRASFFRGELLAALKILDHGDVMPAAMTGSYAGAMGQPQFMPSSYLRYAVDFEGNGRRDIWTSTPDVLGSIANYLARSGWHNGQSWGQPVSLSGEAAAAGREVRRPLHEWARAGVRPSNGSWQTPLDTPAALLAPDGATGDCFIVFANFAAIRRYNPSDFYALAVGLIGDQVLG